MALAQSTRRHLEHGDIVIFNEQDPLCGPVRVEYLVTAPDGILDPIRCEACGGIQGLEPIYNLAQAAAFVPFESVGACRVWLSQNQQHMPKPRYKKVRARWLRYLSISEISIIRNILFNPHRRGRGPGAPEAALIRFANSRDAEQRAEHVADEIERRAKQ